jgi:dynein light chain 1, axonemal
MTTISAALKNWEAKEEGRVAVEAVKLELYCQTPPIAKLDSSINSCVECEHLALSTNCIDRLIPLPGLTKLKILSVGRNHIKKIEHLDAVAGSLEQLWLSYNQISALDNLSGLSNLTTLYVSNNNIKNWAELDKIADLPNLAEILLVGNPIYDEFTKEMARVEVLKHLPNLTKIDGDMVKPSEREMAAGGGVEE